MYSIAKRLNLSAPFTWDFWATRAMPRPAKEPRSQVKAADFLFSGGNVKSGSSLLINEPALQVLPSLAVKIGLNEAIILQQIHFWISGNQQRGAEPFEGRYWTYNTMKEWQRQFPWWSEKTIQRTILKLEKIGLILSRAKENGSYDHTKTYSIDYDKLDGTICLDQLGQDDQNDKDKLSLSMDTKSPDLIAENPTKIPTKRTLNKGAGASASKKSEPDPRSKHPAILLYKELVKRYPNKDNYDHVISILGDKPDIELAKKCWQAWCWVSSNTANCTWLDWYKLGGPPDKNKPAGNRSTPFRNNPPAPKSTLTPEQIAEGRRMLAETEKEKERRRMEQAQSV